jgi:hypothetical protein
MRFSLRSLLLVFPLLLALYGVSYQLSETVHWGTYNHGAERLEKSNLYARSEILGRRPKNGANSTEFQVFQQSFDFAKQTTARGGQMDVDDLNAAVQELPSKDPIYRMKLDHAVHPRRDLWGNYFQWIALDENDRPLPGVQLANDIGLYSTGPDGLSTSWGNDSDDYNSWNTTEEQYEALFDQGLSRQVRQRTLQTMPAMFVFLFAAAFIYWNRDKHRSKPRSYYPRDDRPWGER